jgi:hypothetical protein
MFLRESSEPPLEIGLPPFHTTFKRVATRATLLSIYANVALLHTFESRCCVAKRNLGTIFLTICSIREQSGQMRPDHLNCFSSFKQVTFTLKTV